MSSLTIQQMFELMEADLDEANCSYYGGRAVGMRWLREAYSNLWAKIVDRDTRGEFVGAETAATYTANQDWMAITTWSSRGMPAKIYRAGYRAAGVSSGLGTKIDFIEYRDQEQREQDSTAPYLMILGQNLGMRPKPTVNTTLVLTYAPPSLQLWWDGMAGAPAPPVGFLTWAAYVPPFLDDHYEAIPAYAVVLAEAAENKPNNEHSARAAMLEQSLLEAIVRSVQIQNLPQVAASNKWRYMF